MRRNSVKSSVLETSESRSGHTKEKPRTEQAHTKLPIILASSTAAHESLHRSYSWVDCRPRRVRRQVDGSRQQMQLGEDRQEPTMLSITTAYSTFGKTKSLKTVDWSHRLSVQTTFVIAQYTGRKWKWTNWEDSLRLQTFWPTTVKQKHQTKKNNDFQAPPCLLLLRLFTWHLLFACCRVLLVL